MLPTQTNHKDLVLIGGGHSHAQLLRMWGMQPLAGVRVTLVSPNSLTPYSGMLPGLVAGNYSFAEAHIDLPRLCKFAGARFVREAVTGIDLERKEIQFGTRPALGFDLLSINSGITPSLLDQPDAAFGTPVKPIAEFYPHWQRLLQQLQQDSSTEPFDVAVVGGGAAGVELVFCMRLALCNLNQVKRELRLHLLHQGSHVPQGYPRALQDRVRRNLQEYGIHLHCDSTVTAARSGLLQIRDRDAIPVDHVFWCTPAQAPAWPATAGLATDEKGFIALNGFLQSTSHDFVFAAGDVAQQLQTPRPRAGVFAVRQAPILFENLRRSLLHQPLKLFRPQSSFLSLLVCGDRVALGCRIGGFMPVVEGAWVWRWKDRIDQKFMHRFSQLSQPMTTPQSTVDQNISGELDPTTLATEAMRCGGCGAKVGATILQRVVRRLRPIDREGVVIGLQQPDDAAAIRVPEKQLLLQSVDVFRALLDDPYILGKIAAEHALSDIFAMHATPHSALAIATLPYAAEDLIERDLLQLMSGAIEVLNLHQCALIGGHTSEGSELSIGFSVNGVTAEEQLLQKASLQAGHHMILTQPLGTGALFAAHSQLQAQGPWLDEAIEWMLTSNKEAADIFYRADASACTDITGFGLLGHLLEMLKPQQLGAIIRLPELPALTGVLEVMKRGITSSLHPDNMRLRRAICDLEHWPPHENYQLLFDPQTSGGLLGCVPPENVEQCLGKLRAAGYTRASVIGEIQERSVSHADEPSVELVS